MRADNAWQANQSVRTHDFVVVPRAPSVLGYHSRTAPDRATLTWNRPAGATSYTLQLYRGNVRLRTSARLGSNVGHLDVTGLNADTQHRFRVVVHSAGGDSNWSAWRYFRTTRPTFNAFDGWITTNGARVWASANTSATVLRTHNRNVQVRVIGQTTGTVVGGSNVWYQLQGGGYIHSSLVSRTRLATTGGGGSGGAGSGVSAGAQVAALRAQIVAKQAMLANATAAQRVVINQKISALQAKIAAITPSPHEQARAIFLQIWAMSHEQVVRGHAPINRFDEAALAAHSISGNSSQLFTVGMIRGTPDTFSNIGFTRSDLTINFGASVNRNRIPTDSRNIIFGMHSVLSEIDMRGIVDGRLANLYTLFGINYANVDITVNTRQCRDRPSHWITTITHRSRNGLESTAIFTKVALPGSPSSFPKVPNPRF